LALYKATIIWSVENKIQHIYHFYELRRASARLFYDYRGMLKQSIPTSLFGRRLRQARKRIGIAQDKLGIALGMDENCSSARISRYETGIHEPPIATIEKIAIALSVPLPYFFCEDDPLAEILIHYADLNDDQKDQLLSHMIEISKKI